jgi:FkbM family methyltransferase
MSFNSPLDKYIEYIKKNLPQIEIKSLSVLLKAAVDTNWDDPTTAMDLNNIAVIQLIEAEETEDLSLRQLNLELALESLQNSLDKDRNHLCIAHLGVIHSLRGETDISHQLEFPTLLRILQATFTNPNKSQPGLVYLPIGPRNHHKNKESLSKIITLDNSYLQALYLLIAELEQSQLVFYSQVGLRLLNWLNQIIPDSVTINLNLGISNLFNRQSEGLFYLHKGRKIKPDYSPIVQSLYLAYRDFQDETSIKYWHDYGQNYYENNPQDLSWSWANLPRDNAWTYLPFEGNLLIVVEPTFHSIVTCVLLAQQDWFEWEMELWRDRIQEGMTVIDVGANVGVYTFSAANRVGKNGQVLAVEPSNNCLDCLRETCRINNLTRVKVCAGAASNYNGKANLFLHSSSEENEIISDGGKDGQNYAEVNCFTLDSLLEKNNLSRVDWLKIDAEGHEVQVLQGSSRILSEFKPSILYENIAGSKGSNIPVAEFLLSRGYELFYYQPFVKQLISLNSLQELSGKLNIIALSKNSVQ